MATYTDKDFVLAFMDFRARDPYTVIDNLMERFAFDKREKVNSKIAALRKKGVALPDLPRGKRASNDSVDELNDLIGIYTEDEAEAESEDTDEAANS